MLTALPLLMASKGAEVEIDHDEAERRLHKSKDPRWFLLVFLQEPL